MGVLKQCSKCGAIKPVDDFYRDSRKRDGFYAACKLCHKKLCATWAESNRERKCETNRRWQATNSQRRYEAFQRRYARTDSVVPIRKRCCTCGQDKSSAEFHRKKDASDGLYPRCKTCRANSDREWRKENESYLSDYERRRYLTDPNRRDHAKKWYEANKARALATRLKYAQQHPEITRAAKKRYVALHGHYTRRLMRAIVKWANFDAIYWFYKERDRQTAETGIKHHVHHIVPISNDWVCGLHHEFNLQVTTAKDNLSMSNRSWPDMPEFLDQSVRYTKK